MRFVSVKPFYAWLSKNFKTFWIGDIIEAREMDQIFLQQEVMITEFFKLFVEQSAVKNPFKSKYSAILRNRPIA
jgi:hypothetical protein